MSRLSKFGSACILASVLMGIIWPTNTWAAELPEAYGRKIQAALRFYEFSRDDVIRLTRLGREEQQGLRALLEDAPWQDDETHSGAALLLALNCVEWASKEWTIYSTLAQYRCKKTPLALLAAQALLSFGDLAVLAFVKPEDVPDVVGFLTRYVDFWEKESERTGNRVRLGESDLAYLHEIRRFLAEGGYPLPKR